MVGDLLVAEGFRREQRVNTIRVWILIALLVVSGLNFWAHQRVAMLVVDLSVCILGLLACLALASWMNRPEPSAAVHPVAIVLDVGLVGASALGHALALGSASTGAQHDAILVFVFVIGTAAAMRFREDLPVLAASACGLLVVGCFVFDRLWAGIPLDPITLLMMLVAVATIGVIGRKIVTRSKQLMVRGIEKELERSRAEAERHKARTALSRYVSKEVADEILAHETARPKAIRREVTVLFCDVRGFTSLSERLDPEAVVALLNDYFDAVVAPILDHGGMVDKYMGDGIMAVFGAPLAYPDHALRAFRAALDMRRALEWFNVRQRDRQGPELAIGIGLHTGECIVGDIGGRDRLDYTAIGDTVNTASRLESATKTVGADLLLSAATRRALPDDVETDPPVAIEVKGKAEPLEVYPVGRRAGVVSA